MKPTRWMGTPVVVDVEHRRRDGHPSPVWGWANGEAEAPPLAR